MPIITPETTIIIAAIISPLILLLSAWITRASTKEVFSGVIAGLAFSFTNMLWDQIAFHFGLWSYPAFAGNTFPFFLYIASGVVSGGAFGLIGWKISQHYGKKGFIIFIIVWTLWGIIHDFGGSVLFTTSNLILFANGLLPVLFDGLLYLTCGIIAQIVLRLLLYKKTN